jgi:hypothetical protein
VELNEVGQVQDGVMVVGHGRRAEPFYETVDVQPEHLEGVSPLGLGRGVWHEVHKRRGESEGGVEGGGFEIAELFGRLCGDRLCEGSLEKLALPHDWRLFGLALPSLSRALQGGALGGRFRLVESSLARVG